MENSKLMTPLFYDGMFNREGRRMRAVLEKEISDGTQTYRLWRAAGKPDLDYPRAENDKYILYVEINGYLATHSYQSEYSPSNEGWRGIH